MQSTIFAVLTFLAAAGCSDITDAEDPADGVFGGKGDAFGIEEGSPAALGVLRVANELTYTELRNDVSLAKRASENIVESRSGEDGELGTDDDVSFETLRELDKVSYVGEIAFRKLLEYAETNGYIDGEDDVYEIINYRYGNAVSSSTFVMMSDGSMTHEEKSSAASSRTVEHDPLEPHMVEAINSWIQLSMGGPWTSSAGEPSTVGGSYGHLITYRTGEEPIEIDVIAFDTNDDGYSEVTFNESVHAKVIRELVTDVVERDIPLPE